MKELIVSRIKTPDGTILTSKSVHDYVSHEDTNGEFYFLDGGIEYQRMTVNTQQAEDLSLFTDDPFEEIRNALYIYNRNLGDWQLLKDLDQTLLQNLLENKKRANKNDKYAQMYQKEIEYRNEHVNN
jgi:hypothetical protein